MQQVTQWLTFFKDSLTTLEVGEEARESSGIVFATTNSGTS